MAISNHRFVHRSSSKGSGILQIIANLSDFEKRSSKVPEFGKWEGGEDVPYTAYFDKASKAKSERKKSNDPSLQREEISETVSSKNVQHKTREGVHGRKETESPLHCDALELRDQDNDGLKSEKNPDQQASRSKHTQEDLNLEDGNTKKHRDSSLEHQTREGQEVSFNSPLPQLQANNTASTKNVAGSDCIIENSPLQLPTTEAKTVVPASPIRDSRGSGSPKGGRHDFIASSTPGRSRQRSVPQGNETPDQSVTVPKFGDWDESDPSASENYSNIFTQIRDERRTEDGSMPVGTNVYSNRSAAENPKKCCCFPWGK